MSIQKRITVLFILFAIILTLGGEFLLSAFSVTAKAETVTYSNVLDDLQKDENFDPNDYPSISDDYSLHLITMAESDSSELLIYVYQPSGDDENLRATTINISTAYHSKNIFVNYALTYLNSSGVFFKYKVNDIILSADKEHCYEVSSIYRDWNSNYDGEVGSDNTVSEVSYPVGKQFLFTTEGDGIVSLSIQDVEYIEVTDKYVGYVRYIDESIGFGYVYVDHCDAHFVAFSTDREIDDLLEADVYFKSQTYTKVVDGFNSFSEEWSDIEEHYVYLTSTQEASTLYGDTFVKSEANWNRIQKTEDFLAMEYETDVYVFPGFEVSVDVTFTDDALTALANTNWVLSFAETSYEYDAGYEHYYNSFSRVGDVSVLRLKFQTNGVIYDLGVVDNKQTGAITPSVVVENEDWFQKIIALLLIILFVVLIAPVTSILKFIWSGVKTLLKIIWSIVSFPFKLIKKMFSG